MSRSIIDFHNLMKEFEKFNCSFVSITQAFDTSTSMGKLTLNMLLSFAQFEREVSGERIRDKIAATKAKGFWVGGCPPLGYDIVDKKLVVNKNEAKQIRLIFEKYMELKSVRKLKEFLLDTDVRTKKWTNTKGVVKGGKVFSSSMLARILRAQVYAGKIESKKDKVSYNGRHEAVIDKKMFAQVQAVIDGNQQNEVEKYERSTYLLSGKVFDEKGLILKNWKGTKNKVKKYRYYALKGKYIPAGDIDEIALGVVENLFHCRLDGVLDESRSLEFKSVDYSAISRYEQENLVKSLIDKIILNGDSMTIFINLDDLSYLKPFKKEGWINRAEREADFKAFISQDRLHLVIEKEISINQRHSSCKYLGNSKVIISREENGNNLIKALSIGWRYGKRAAEGMNISRISKNEHRAPRTIYKYMNLNFLSPRIVNSIMNGETPTHINLQNLFEIAGTYGNFEEQEKFFFNHHKPINHHR